MKKTPIPIPSLKSISLDQRRKRAAALRADWVADLRPKTGDIETRTEQRVKREAALASRRAKTEVREKAKAEITEKWKATLAAHRAKTEVREKAKADARVRREAQRAETEAREKRKAALAAHQAKTEAREKAKAEIEAKGERSKGKGSRSFKSCKSQLRKHHEELKDDPEHLPTEFIRKLVGYECEPKAQMGRPAQLSDEERKERNREEQRKYRQTPEYKEWRRKYRQRPENRKKRREYQQKYERRPEVRERRRRLRKIRD
jgi:colicin import membrane protein